MKQLTEHEFDTLFNPIKNHLVKNASWNGCLYETYGPELDFVLSKIDENLVITIIECSTAVEDIEDEEACVDMYLSTGYHYVNRIGYLILDKPYEFEFEVKLD
jgi:hypothetical protein